MYWAFVCIGQDLNSNKSVFELEQTQNQMHCSVFSMLPSCDHIDLLCGNIFLFAKYDSTLAKLIKIDARKSTFDHMYLIRK